VPEGGVSGEDKEFILSHRPIYSEEGLATWYTAPDKGRQASAMRISDRGPFVPTAILDLTRESAKSIGIYPGSGRVRVDVYETPKPMEVGGRWCVQIGPLTTERKAIKLKEKLLRDYAGSRVIEFPGERSYWVRIRPEGDDRGQAEEMARHIEPDEGVAYLTRLD
jgi:rare lipoprotein A